MCLAVLLLLLLPTLAFLLWLLPLVTFPVLWLLFPTWAGARPTPAVRPCCLAFGRLRALALDREDAEEVDEAEDDDDAGDVSLLAAAFFAAAATAAAAAAAAVVALLPPLLDLLSWDAMLATPLFFLLICG